MSRSSKGPRSSSPPRHRASSTDMCSMSTAASPRASEPRLAVVVMGVSGCGKSSVAAGLAHALQLDWVDGDDLHLSTSIAKMSRGEALGDAERWPWLDRIGLRLADSHA